MTNCSHVRQLTIDVSFGDVYGGIYCPEGLNSMINCPIGSYCPSPEEQLECPAGKFCSYKSAQPWLDCGNCEAGATEQERHTFGWTILGIVLLVNLVWLALSCLKKHRQETFAKYNDLLSRQTDSLKVLAKRRKKRREQLHRLKPKLDLILKRLSKQELEHHASILTRSSAPSIEVNEDTMFFDARRLYDTLDTDRNGELSYEELNMVLELDDNQIAAFMTRMQELGGLDASADTVKVRH